MLEILEIFAAVMAVFGIYTVLDMLRLRLLYPPSVRRLLRVAIFVDNELPSADAVAYTKYLRLEKKISNERLIILTNNDIIKNNSETARFGEVYGYINYKEADDDAEHAHGREDA